MIPDAECWLGDYPYLNRPEMEALLADDDELWNKLRSQGRSRYAAIEEIARGNKDFDRDENNREDDETVKVRRSKWR